jgi:SAM-dependent methyltransferase
MSDYYKAQASKFDKLKGGGIGIERKTCFINLILQNIDRVAVKSVLLIGCSNADEKHLFEQAGFYVNGIDIFPGKGITKMDMHDLKYDAGSFDLIVLSHSFEHCEDPGKVLSQINHMLRPRGYIAMEIPIHYKPDLIDRFDFGSFKTLKDIIGSVIPCSLVFGKDYPKGDKENFCGGDCSKLIVRKM